jgi:hypothetical protein
MASTSFNKVGRWALAVVAVALVASLTFAAGVQVVSAKPVANTAVVVLKNSGAQPVAGSLVVNAVTLNGRAVQSAASFSVGAGSLASVVVVFDAPIGSISGVAGGDCGAILDDSQPF